MGECAGTFAFVVVDGRMYVFSIWRSGQDALLEAMLSTVTFRPSPQASPSATPTTPPVAVSLAAS